ncbi:MAG: DUF2442 domain-containing protein [Bifidobacteriaceae bacterium]|jgi:hypothetical protein|nr:DUF2442 domain-containing protein [Bifidobacteriaceae bacterium]
MRVAEGIASVGGQDAPPKIVAVRALDGGRLELALSTGKTRVFDVTPYLRHAVYAPLANPAVFRAVRLDHGVPTWLGGQLDFSPETLIKQSQPAARARPA